MEIIPNFIEDIQIQEEIKNTLIGERRIPYYYNNYTVNDNDKSDFHFVHFYTKIIFTRMSVVQCLTKYYHH